MKTLSILVLLGLHLTAFSQKPVYDSLLANKLHADKNGMKKYILVILKTGPGDTIKGKLRDSLFTGHMQNIGRLAEKGLLSVAGPMGKNDQKYRGIFVLNVESIEEARQICETDPTVKAKIFTLELFNWYASAALQETNRIHESIDKNSSR